MTNKNIINILSLYLITFCACGEDPNIDRNAEFIIDKFESNSERILDTNIFFNESEFNGEEFKCKLEYMIHNNIGEISSKYLSEFMDSTSQYKLTFVTSNCYKSKNSNDVKHMGDDTLGLKMCLNVNANQFLIIVNPNLLDSLKDPSLLVNTILHESLHVALDIAICEFHHSSHMGITLPEIYMQKFDKSIPNGLFEEHHHHIMANHFIEDLMQGIAEYYTFNDPSIFESIAYMGLETDSGFSNTYWFQQKLIEIDNKYELNKGKLIDPCPK